MNRYSIYTAEGTAIQVHSKLFLSVFSSSNGPKKHTPKHFGDWLEWNGPVGVVQIGNTNQCIFLCPGK